jgi:restriction system protein
MTVPKYDDLFNVTLEALHRLGGSASIQELENEVSKILNLSEEDLSVMASGQNQTKFSYRLAWARSYLKRYGAIENTDRGIWALTKKGKELKEVDKSDVKREAKAESRRISRGGRQEEGEPETPSDRTWKEDLLAILQEMKPDAFERLCQRILREAGFVNVEVTGRSGDGGIDGHGVVKIGGLLSFHVYFQAKRYKESVSPSVIRDFRGALMGRADKGLIITAGVFTRDAIKEAQRDGATPVDLMDGNDLTEKLKELNLGVNVKQRTVEEVSIEKDWFDNI